MRLILNDDYIELRDEMKEIVQTSFGIMQDVLGLAQHREDIELEFCYPYAMKGAAAYIDSRRRFPMIMKCRASIPLAEVITSVAHETVHVDDFVKGKLVVSGGVSYEGSYIPGETVERLYNSNSRAAAMRMPHEFAAYTKGPLVAKEVFNRLPVRMLRPLIESVSQTRFVPGVEASKVRAALCAYADVS